MWNGSKLGLPFSGIGAQDHHDLRTHIANEYNEFHPSVRHLNLSDQFSHATRTSLTGLYNGNKESPFKTNDNMWETETPGEQKHQSDYRKLIGAGLKHIWSIPNISDHDRVLLHRHFESQLRHHHVAAVANPKMFDQYHRSMKTARRERDNASGESTGGSSSGGRPYNEQEWAAKWREAQARGPEEAKRVAAEWRRVSKEQETMTRPKAIKILGLSENPTKHEIKAAFRRLTLQHHPDSNPGGGDLETYKAVMQAHDYIRGDLNEWVEMLAEWVSKRYKK